MGKYNFEYAENDYKTPPELYQMALDKFRLEKFGLDACCSDENIPAYEYYKREEKDGLSEPWQPYTWCNPPFNECKKWIKKAFEENKKDYKPIIMLLPVRTETAYWHDFILNNPFVEVEFLRKGYCFYNKNNEKMGVFKNALALVYFHPIPF